MELEFMKKYPHLFEPLVVGKKQFEFKNRVFTAPIHPGAGADAAGLMNNWGIQIYANFARGGFSSIYMPVEIPKDGGHVRSVSIDEENTAFMDVHNMQRVVHAYNCRSFCEIYHPGICMLKTPNNELIGPSAMIYNGNPVREMNEDDMQAVIQMYHDAAIQAKRAGFDGINLHFAHGWLINNFLSPASNHRTDEYGGSVENRCRFPVRVLKAVREAVGDSMIIELRLNGSDMYPGGIEKEDAAQQVLIFQDYVDMIHITCSTRLDATARPKMFPTHFVPMAHNAEFSAYIKQQPGVKIPIGVVGAIQTPDVAEELLAQGKADYVLMVRQAIADNDWVNKVKEGREEDILPCIRCDLCMDGGRRSALTKEVTISKTSTFDRHCSVNPYYGQGAALKMIPLPTRSKKVIVVGGGLAGMQAALTASQRGHKVALYEKSGKLGGQALLSDVMWFKAEMKRLHEYFATQIQKSDVELYLNTEATRELVEAAQPDVVIVAVGAEQIKPRIPGVDGDNVTMAWDVFGHEEKLGEKVVIVGGGLVGCELGIHLAGLGKQVTVLEMADFLAATAQISERMSLMENMEKYHVVGHTETTVKEITKEGVVAEQGGKPVSFPADSVVICAGHKPLKDLRDSFRNCAFDVINVGDCVNASTICHAIETGNNAGLVI